MTKLLYIEDDEIDILALKRSLRKHPEVELTVVTNLAELEAMDLTSYNVVLSDANLPDANLSDLKPLVQSHPNYHFVSGTDIEGERCIIKPISAEQLNRVLSGRVTDMSYINGLADGDDEYAQEMISTALDVLPDRLELIQSSINDLTALQKAAHKAKSSYRVCGMDARTLEELESLDATGFGDGKHLALINEVEFQISQAIKELKGIS
jgi:CheY-like chemotaxis protein